MNKPTNQSNSTQDTEDVVARLEYEARLNPSHPTKSRQACADALALIQSLSDRIDVLEAMIDRAVSGGLPEQLLLDADELEACGAGNEAKRMRELVGRLKEFRRAALHQEGIAT